MAGFNAAFFNEMDKLFKKKKFFAIAVLSIISVIVGQIAITMIKLRFGLRVTGSSEFPIMVLSVFIYTILPLFSAFVAIDMFNGEFSANTMRITLTRPVSRFAVFLAKVLNIAVFIMVNLICVMVLSMAAGLIFNTSTASVSGFIRIILSYLATFLPVFVLSLFVVMLSNIFKGGLTTFFLSVIAFIGLNLLGAVFSSYSSFFITSMFDWYRLWISSSPNVFKIAREFFIMCGCGIMFFTAGYYLFDRKDL